MALAQAHIEAGRFDDAVRVCRLGLPAHPDRVQAHLLFGRALSALGKLATAKQSLLRAVELDPEGCEPTALLIEVLVRRGERSAALALLEQARERWPGDDELGALHAQASALPPDGVVSGDTSLEALATKESEGGDDERGAGARETPSPERWSEVQSAWDEVLEANKGRLSDPVSDLREPSPSSTPAIDVDLPPLADPLARGMPPLPEEEAWSPTASDDDDQVHTVQAVVPELEAILDASSRDGFSEPLAGSERPELTAPLGFGPQTEDAFGQAVAHPDSSAPPPMGGGAQVPVATADTALQPAGSRRIETPRSALAPGPGAPGSEVGAPVVGDNLLSRISAVAESYSPASAPATAPGRRRSKLPLLALAVFVLGGAGVAGWWYVSGRSVAVALQATRVARVSGGPQNLTVALEGLSDARRYGRGSGRLADEAALLRATMSLLSGRSGMGADGVAQVSGGLWVHRATRAALALSDNDIDAAAKQLTGPAPKDPLDTQFHGLLRAWAAWGKGTSTKALELLPPVTRPKGRATWSALLRGLIQLERDELGLADRALRAVIESNPRWRLPQLALAAVLQRNEDSAGNEGDALIDGAAESPIDVAMQRILRVERAVRRKELDAASAAKSLVQALKEAPSRRWIVDMGAVALSRLCRFGEARKQIERLAPKAAGSDGMAWLRVELALAAGLDERALNLLPEALDGPRSTRLALRARLYARQLAQVKALLAQSGDRSHKALSDYVGDDAQERSGTVDAAVTHSPQVSLTLAAAGLASDDPALALRLAHPLRDDPALGPRARWIMARALLSQGNRPDALAEAKGALKRCSGLARANELVGQLYLEQGIYDAAEAAFRAARSAGSRAPGLLLLHARALAELSRLDEAKELLARGKDAGGSAPDLSLARAQLALAAGKPTDCRSALTKVRHEGLAASLLRGRCLAAGGQLAEAELVLLETRRGFPQQPMPALLLGLVLRRQKSPEAGRHLRAAIELGRGKRIYRRSLSRAYLGLAREATKRGRPGRVGFARLAEAIHADDQYAEPFVQLGQWRLQQGRGQDARRALERAVEIDPRDANTYHLLALAQKGDSGAQRRSYEALLRLKPEGERADAARLALSRLP